MGLRTCDLCLAYKMNQCPAEHYKVGELSTPGWTFPFRAQWKKTVLIVLWHDLSSTAGVGGWFLQEAEKKKQLSVFGLSKAHFSKNSTALLKPSD